MKMLLSAFLFISITTLSCRKKNDNPQVVYYKAEVVSTDDINCHRPRIQIDVTDTAAVSKVSGVATEVYIASQLPASLNTVGQKLNITIAKFATGEDFACGSIGVSYSHLKVVTAVSRN